MKIFHVIITGLSIFVVPLVILIMLKGGKVRERKTASINLSMENYPYMNIVTQGKLLSWQQLKTKCDKDCFFALTIELRLDGELKEYVVSTVIKYTDIPRLKKGMLVTVKYEKHAPEKMVVVEIKYE